MKRRVRPKLWWPLVDRDVEKFVKRCHECLLVSRPNPPAPMNRRALPEGPWLCLAMDLLGPLPSHEYVFVVIDYYSRYHELRFVKKITSAVIIDILEEMFSRLGYPTSITADNGRQFVSDEFKRFCADNAIDLMTSPPYWPQANGEVENINRSILKRLQIAHSRGVDYKKEIQKFILMYNVTPHGTTGRSPSELLFNRRLRDKIPSIHDIKENILDEEAKDMDMLNKEKGKQKGDTNRGAKENEIRVGDKVLLRNVLFPNKLTTNFDTVEYEVIDRSGNDIVIRGNGKVFRRNISHVKRIPVLDSLTTEFPESGALAPSSTATNDEPGNSNQKLILKLKNKGGVWRPGSPDARK
ncbi:uncharacterized protein K02A2.6-like [Anastrepha ludens]|uniref:uncharacterized protein K02A2.6-like n=1 Tax=Anastrepha ludens TaxID=28586 RepID=UPI0023AF11C9|nr:uncharacterized protein K02A2.6-like [Anastrepha ludens]